MAKRFIVPAITTVLVLTVLITLPRGAQNWIGMSSLSGEGMGVEPNMPPWEQIAQRYPDDWRAQHAWADMAPDAKESVTRYDKVIARFPDKAALYAGRVSRYAQMISFKRPEEEQIDKYQLPYTPSQDVQSGIKRAIAAAREGMKVEPDNAFYNYALASCLFGLHRDEEALMQMAEGARKPRYDSHVSDAGLNRIHVDKLAHGAVMTHIAAWSGVLLAHCAKERQVARLVTWYGKQAEQKGDHALALQRYGQVLRMGEHVMDGSHMLIEALVGAAIEWIGLHRGIKRDRSALRRLRDEAAIAKYWARHRRQMTQEFADYATAHGRADLASAAWRGLKKARTAKEDWAEYFVGQDRERFRNVEEPYAALTRYLRILAGQSGLIVQAALALLMALITALLAWRLREKQQVSWLTAFCVASICWLPAAVLLYINCKRVPNLLGWESAESPFSPLLFGAAVLLPFLLEDVCWGVRTVWQRLRRGVWKFDSPPLLPRTCVMLALLSLFAYVILLVPLKRAEIEANAYTERIAAGEVQVAREALEKGKRSNP